MSRIKMTLLAALTVLALASSPPSTRAGDFYPQVSPGVFHANGGSAVLPVGWGFGGAYSSGYGGYGGYYSGFPRYYGGYGAYYQPQCYGYGYPVYSNPYYGGGYSTGELAEGYLY